MCDFRPGLSTQPEMTAEYLNRIATAERVTLRLVEKIEKAKTLPSPHWANVGDVNHLISILDDAERSIAAETR